MPDKSPNNTKKDKSILEILYIVYRGKNIIISIVFLFLILAYLYNKFSTPVFESKALLKKEITSSRSQTAETNELYEFVRIQTHDRLETEMELIRTEHRSY